MFSVGIIFVASVVGFLAAELVEKFFEDIVDDDREQSDS